MNKLTAEECKFLIMRLTESRWDGKISIKEKKYLAALEIALPVLEQQEKGGWIEWGGGAQPIEKMEFVEVKFRDATEGEGLAYWWEWSHDGATDDIIAYRVIEQQERERGEEE